MTQVGEPLRLCDEVVEKRVVRGRSRGVWN
jgi:hypothetical protein